MRPTALLLHRLAQSRQFALHRLSGILQRMHAYGTVRHGRAVFPHDSHCIVVGTHGGTDMAQFRLHRLHLVVVHHHAIHGDTRATLHGEFSLHPLQHRRSVRQSVLHQLKLRVLQLFRRLQEIARVGPQRSLLARHHRRACRTVKARHPFACVPMWRNVFACMRVGTGKYHNVNALCCHFAAQQCQTVIYCCHGACSFVK